MPDGSPQEVRLPRRVVQVRCSNETTGGYSWSDIGPLGVSHYMCMESRHVTGVRIWEIDANDHPVKVVLARGVFSEHMPVGLTAEEAMGADGVGVGTVADPVNTATGDLTESKTDLALVDLRTEVAMSRTYNSSDTRIGALGSGWRTGFELTATVDAAGAATVVHPSGRTVVYAPDGSGGFKRPPGASETLATVNGLLRLSDANREATFNADGKVTSIRVPDSGDTLTYTYTSGRVSRIAGPTRYIDLAYTAAGRLDMATADDGRVVDYDYLDGQLSTVTSPGGKTVTYDYERTTIAPPSVYTKEVDADGPVAYWKLGESSGTQAVDRRGKHHGTYGGPLLGTSAAVYKDTDTGVQFDGVNDSITVPHNAAMPGTGSLTLEAWVKPDAASATFQPIISKGGSGTFEIAADFRATPAPRSLSWRSDSGGALQWNNFFTPDLDGQYVHVVVTVSGTTATAYRNGALFGSITIGTRTASTLDVSLGKRTGSGTYWLKGVLDEAAIYAKVLSAGRVAAHYRAARPYAAEVGLDNPTAFWRLGETSDMTATDEQGNHNAALSGTYTAGRPGAMAHDADKGMGFGGGAAAAPHGTALAGTGDMTVEAWVKPDASSATYQPFISKGSPGTYEIGANFTAGKTGSLEWRSHSSTRVAAEFFPETLAGRWVHVAVVISGTNVSFYRNGTLFSTTTIASRTANTNALSIGRRSSTTTFKGDLDDVAYYGKALSAARVAAHFRAARPYPSAVKADSPAVYLRLGETAPTEADGFNVFEEGGIYNAYRGAAGAYVYPKAGALPNEVDGATGFNSSAASVRVMSMYAPDGTGNMTLEAWAKPVATNASWQVIASKGNTYELAAEMRANTNNRALVWRSGGVSTYVPNFFTTALDDKYVHIAVAVSGTSASVYRNGALVTTLTNLPTRTADTSDFVVGQRSGGGYQFRGNVDEASLYNTKLSTTRILAHYEAGRWAPKVVTEQPTVITGRLLSETGVDGVLVHRTAYDAQGRVKSQTDADGGETTFAYNVDSSWTGTVTATDPAGGKWIDKYSNRVLTARTTADEVTTQFMWDEKLRLIEQVTPFSWSRMSYDAQGRLTATQTPEGTARTTYDTGGRVKTSVSAAGVALTNAYDDEGRLDTVTDSFNDRWGNTVTNGTTDYDYYPNGTIQSLRDAENGLTQFEYNAAGQVTKTTSPNGVVEERDYYPQGWLKWVQTAAGRVSFTYNGDGDLTTTTDPAQQVSTNIYDPVTHRLKRAEDHSGRFTEYRYDDAGRVETTTDHAGAKITFGYDGAGRVASTRACYSTDLDAVCTAEEAGIRASTRSYDSAGRVESITDSTGTSTTTYLNGLPKTVSRPGGDLTYDYDDRGRLVKTSGDGDDEVVTYDAFGRVRTKERGTAQKVLYNYNGLSQVSSVTVTDTVVGINETTSYTYDKMGRTETVTNPGNVVDSFTYRPDGQPQAVRRGNTVLALYDYEPLTGRLASVSLADGTVEAYTYDSLGRPETRRVTDPSGTLLDREDMSYDQRGNPVKVIRRGGAVTTYGYDNDDQLLRVCEGVTDPMACTAATATESFTYDNFGNRMSRQSAAGAESYRYNGINQMVGVCQGVTNPENCTEAATTAGLTYDARGRAATIGSLTLDYDPATDKVIGATHTDGRSWSWRYDANGYQVRSTATTAAGSTTTSTFSNDPLSGAVMAATTGTTTENFLPAGLGSEIGAFKFTHKDRLGSPSTVTSSSGAATAQVLHAYEYEAFGAEKASSTPDPASNRTHGNHVKGPEGLVLMQGRPYAPSLGRFLTIDPRGEAYLYAQNSPLLYSDPSGELACLGNWGIACSATVSKWADRLSTGLLVVGAVAAVVAAPVTGGTSLALAAGAISSGAFAASRVAGAVAGAADAHVQAAACAGKGSCSSLITSTAMSAAFRLVKLPKFGGSPVASNLTDQVDDMAPQATREVILDTNAVYRWRDAQGLLRAGDVPVITRTTQAEIRNLAAAGRMKPPGYLDDFGVIDDVMDVNTRITIRGAMRPGQPGLFGDGSIGATAINRGSSILTYDRNFADVLRQFGVNVL